MNPNMQMIYEVKNRLQGAFSINITTNGTYYFVFNNFKVILLNFLSKHKFLLF